MLANINNQLDNVFIPL